MPVISVILPVFNSEEFIRKAIESVLAQTFEDFELIIVNDGSTDSSKDIIDSFKDDRIRLINQSNHGPGAARNNALKIAQGRYVMYLDSDDWFTSDALEVAYGEITKFDADMTFFKMINFDGERYYENDWFELKTLQSFKNRTFKPIETPGSIFDLSVGVCQKIYNRSFLERIDARFPEGIFFEDMPFFYYVLLKSERISIIKRHLYFRRKHDESITHIVDCKFLDTVPAGQEMMKRFIENGWYDAYKFDLLAYKINGPRFALRDIEEKYKVDMYLLIKNDYDAIKQSQYYQDYLDNLGPVKRKFFLDILESTDYDDFRRLNSQ